MISQPPRAEAFKRPSAQTITTSTSFKYQNINQYKKKGKKTQSNQTSRADEKQL